MNISKSIEIITQKKQDARTETAKLPQIIPEREESLNLSFRKGDTVYDRRTGKKLTIIAGTRKSVTIQTT